MGELLQLPERERTAMPAYVIYSRHDESDLTSLKDLDRSIQRCLQQTRRQVVVFCEDNASTPEKAGEIENMFSQGYPLSTCYAMGEFFQRYGHKPSQANDEDKAHYNAALDGMSKFEDVQMEIIDRHRQESQRIQLLWEFQDEPLPERERRIEITRNKLDLAYHSVMTGKFDKGLTHYKTAVIEYAADDRKREDKFAKRIIDLSQDNEVGAFAGSIGHSHTRFGRILKSRGLELYPIFPEKGSLPFWDSASEESVGSFRLDTAYTYIWSPTEQAIRHFISHPEKNYSESSWIKFLLGGAIYDYYYEARKAEADQTGTPIKYQEIALMTNLKMDLFKKPTNIAEFQKVIIEQGFKNAVGQLTA